ncbi:uncharacterized protein LOC143051019 isoform X1 [Mytilus galloprovincialis]|uniref:uncharacterized protein LOC143051019 isoform X1 n=1 Tax=Mytilus galloprovincialis TaxID=29158 RepID=UPI003F7B98DB
MKSVILTITVLLGLLFVPVIEMKSKRCHKRPTVVECPDLLTRTCGKNSNITVTTKNKLVGDTEILDCSTGYSLVGIASITCLESGVWGQIRAIYLVKSASFNIGLESRNGINYEWQSKNTTESNMFDDWADREPKTIEVDSCGFIYNLKWYAARRVACVIQPYSFICESRFD